jgi:hypothetical protein
MNPKPSKSNLSPLKLYQEMFCQNCLDHCSPSEARFQTCILAAFLNFCTRHIEIESKQIYKEKKVANDRKGEE